MTTTSTHTRQKSITIKAIVPDKNPGGSVIQLLIAVAGIYSSFLTWAVLQERISTTPYGPEQRFFRASVVINTVQSFCAAVVGLLYTRYTTKGKGKTENTSVFPNLTTCLQYLLVATTSSLASPFGYASLKHIDYLTLLLGKSCKLLPVMALHVIVFRKKYSINKYLVVLAVTLGVSLFTIYHPTTSSKLKGPSNSSSYGLLLLGINLLFDGLTNSTQDHIFHSQPTITGPKMMCGINVMSTVITTAFLLTPLSTQLQDSIEFFKLYPQVMYDILMFSACGAIGQVFIFFTMSKFGSLTLVMITVTRKMMSMLLSVVWFKHRLTLGQWIGVSMVFIGVGGEALTKYIENRRKREVVVAVVDKAE